MLLDKPFDAGKQDFEIIRHQPESRIASPRSDAGGAPDEIIVRRCAQDRCRAEIEGGNVTDDIETKILAQHRFGLRLPVLDKMHRGNGAVAQFVPAPHVLKVFMQWRSRSKALESGQALLL